MAKRDYYEVLGIESTATVTVVKKAFKRVALDLHPDRNPDDPEAEDKMKEASEAYSVLNDPEKRATYDRHGHEGLSGQGVGGFGDMQDIFSHFSDIFDGVFGGGMGGMGGTGGRRRRTAPSRGADVRAAVLLSLREAAFGAQKELEVTHPTPCEPCRGTGAEGAKLRQCGGCGGSGQVAHARGPFVLSTTCGECGGEGATAEKACDECHGRGEVPSTRTVKLTVPGGVDTGQTLRLTSQGQAGRLGGPSGHLYVTVEVAADEQFHRDGYDLIHELHLSYPQAALGDELELPTLDDEPERIKIPAGVQPGDTMVVNNAGVPRLDGRGRGDLIAVIQVDVPKELSPRARELLEELAATFSDES